MWIRKFIRINRIISFNLSNRIPGLFRDADYSSKLLGLINESIKSSKQPLRILEIGGINRPLLSKSKKYTYIGMDIDFTENCNNLYDHFIIGSVEEPIVKNVDLIISKTLLEHVENNEDSYKQMMAALNSGGKIIHYFPAKNHPYSILTRLISHKWQRKLISLLRSNTIETTGYKTYYHLCSYSELRNYLKSLNFKQVVIQPFWGASDYFTFFVPFFILVSLFNRLCEKLHMVYFASGLIVIANQEE